MYILCRPVGSVCVASECVVYLINVLFCLSCFNREGGGVGDASIRKTAYFEGAQDPTLYGKVNQVIE